jgi:hypothetical protein
MGATSPEKLSVAYKLAVIDGDPSEEAAFQAAIDCIMASGIRGAETERKVGTRWLHHGSKAVSRAPCSNGRSFSARDNPEASMKKRPPKDYGLF